MFDVTGLQPEAQSIVQAASAIYYKHTSSWFIGLIAHGSAVKGGFIPGCSDIDLQLYLEDAAYSEHGQLPLSTGMAIQRDLSHIDPAPFQYLQCYALPPLPQPNKVGPIPGAYRIVAGKLPVLEATDDQLYASARKAILTLNPELPYIHTCLLEHGGGKLARQVRFICTDIWPMLYHVLTLQQPDPIHIWGLPKVEAINLLPPDTTIGQAIRAFYRAVLAYYTGRQTVEQALAVFESALAFLYEAKSRFDNAEY